MNKSKTILVALSIVVALGSIGSGLWGAAAFFHKMDTKTDIAITGIEQNTIILNSRSQMFAVMQDDLEAISKDVDSLKNTTLGIIYVDQSTKTILVKLPDSLGGQTVRLNYTE
jgi:hypothetical protein